MRRSRRARRSKIRYNPAVHGPPSPADLEFDAVDQGEIDAPSEAGVESAVPPVEPEELDPALARPVEPEPASHLEAMPDEEVVADTSIDLAELTSGLDQAPDDVALLVARGALFTERQEWEAALADLRRALRLAPEEWDAWDALGRLYWRRGRPLEAADCFRRVTEARPSARAFLMLGKSLVHGGHLREARAALDRAVALDPDCPETYRLLGGLFDRLGRSEEAAAFYRQAQEPPLR
ncbi:MAG: tetratricopeptide repeat protein [Gemmatimonadales bacterium]|nr:tetratricopeptide repeat protein [Gemmatimonadales bacterium]